MPQELAGIEPNHGMRNPHGGTLLHLPLMRDRFWPSVLSMTSFEVIPIRMHAQKRFAETFVGVARTDVFVSMST